ncbi:MAG: LamG domain-containing protein [Holophagales bacterium]|nr:MAG: LamG domain-containing protein [Holophagales bacterium]
MRRSRLRLTPALLLATAFSFVASAGAQPFGAFVSVPGEPTQSYLSIPHDASLNPTGEFTFEAWVAIRNNSAAEDCRSIAGKNYMQAWWIGLCTVGGKPTLRSYIKGGGSARSGGVIPANEWTHIAVTYDGSTRRHYINGEQVYAYTESGPLTTSTSEMRIGGDVSWQHTPTGAIDEVRLWSVARSQSDLRFWINKTLPGTPPGLVAYWKLDANANDAAGGHDGTSHGAAYLTSPVAGGCTGSASALCLYNRFLVTVQWRDNAGVVSNAQVVPGVGTAQSGLLYFINADNWELLAKMVEGCGLNSRYWVFVSGSTELFYRLNITDVTHGVNKVYFSYNGTNPPAITDTDAFAVCP